MGLFAIVAAWGGFVASLFANGMLATYTDVRTAFTALVAANNRLKPAVVALPQILLALHLLLESMAGGYIACVLLPASACCDASTDAVCLLLADLASTQAISCRTARRFTRGSDCRRGIMRCVGFYRRRVAARTLTCRCMLSLQQQPCRRLAY